MAFKVSTSVGRTNHDQGQARTSLLEGRNVVGASGSKGSLRICVFLLPECSLGHGHTGVGGDVVVGPL